MSTATPPKTATKTVYHLLKRIAPTSSLTDPKVVVDAPTFQLVAKDVPGANGQAAIKAHAAKAADPSGTYVAVPSRSFTEQTVKVETQTVVTLA
jgi:hypothetical protein